MGFTQGYKVNQNTQFEFTVSNETLSEVVQDGGITEGDIADYCYTALIDSRVHSLFAGATYDGGWDGSACTSWANEHCAGIFRSPLSGGIADRGPAFNKDLLDTTDQCYQRNFLTWKGTIYPGTENEKTGTFLVMDMKDIKRWYINYDSAGFYQSTVTSAVNLDPLPEGYVWPGYTGTVYGYTNNAGDNYVFHTDNNDPHLNPNTNLRLCNVLVNAEDLWVGHLNPASKGPNQIGGSGLANAANSLYGWFWNASNSATYLSTGEHMYQAHAVAFGAVPDYGGAGDYPGCPNPSAGTLGFNTYFVCDNDNMVVRLSGDWGQQNYASGCSFTNSSQTTDPTTVLKWQSWCGLKFQYNNVMYKPIIQGGIIVGYSDDMDAESEYDDMTSVTGNNISPTPPTPPKPSPGQWDNIEGAGTFNGTLQFVRSYYMSSTELLNLKTWMGKKESDGGPPDGYDMLDSIIAIKMYPFALASGADDNVDITIPGSGSAWAKLNEICWITRVASAIDNTIVPENAPEQYRHINTGCKGHATNASGINYDLGTLNMSDFVNDQYPFFTYDAAVELYIPFIGTFTLDPQTVMGRTLHCYLNLDPSTGGVYGYCLCNNGGTNVMIASGTGNIGVDVPISSAQAGVLQARVDAIRSQQAAGLVTTAAAMALPVVGATAAAGAAAYTEGQMLRGIASAADISSAASATYRSTLARELGNKGIAGEAVATTANALTANRQVKNLTQSHNMAMTGTVGASTAEWGCPWDAYVKVMRPKVHNPGNNYNHAVAVPAYKSGKLSSYKGLTVCINPDASKIAKATPAERNAIASMLQGGVIV